MRYYFHSYSCFLNICTNISFLPYTDTSCHIMEVGANSWHSLLPPWLIMFLLVLFEFGLFGSKGQRSLKSPQVAGPYLKVTHL